MAETKKTTSGNTKATTKTTTTQKTTATKQTNKPEEKKTTTKQEPKTATTTKKTETKKATHKSSSNGILTWGINKISMYTIIAVAVLYLISAILSLFNGVNFKIVTCLQNAATAIMIVIVSILAWRYVKPKQTVWKVLYIICLLLVLLGVVIPLISL